MSKDEKEYIPRIGDLVKVVNYGHLAWVSKVIFKEKPENIVREDNYVWYYDTNPYIVGEKAIVTNIDGRGYLSLQFATNHISWFNSKQIELIRQNPNSIEDLI